MVNSGEQTKGNSIMRQYETMVIIDAMISDDGIAAEVQTIADKITVAGEILRRDDWGKRKLAYLINKKTHGYYVIFYYKAEASVVANLETAFKLNGNVLRWMTLVDYPMTEIIYDQNLGQSTEEVTPIDAEDGEVE
jgi:small subunit ribosomal protein S6